MPAPFLPPDTRTKLDRLAEPDDNRRLNATVRKHGLMPKLSGDASELMNGKGLWVNVSLLLAAGRIIYVADNAFTLYDDLNNAKLAQFQLDQLAVGTNIFTLPTTAAGTFAMVNLAQTFTQPQIIDTGSSVINLLLNRTAGSTESFLKGMVTSSVTQFEVDRIGNAGFATAPVSASIGLHVRRAAGSGTSIVQLSGTKGLGGILSVMLFSQLQTGSGSDNPPVVVMAPATAGQKLLFGRAAYVDTTTGELMSFEVLGSTFDAGTARISSNNLTLCGHNPKTDADPFGAKQGSTLALNFATINVNGTSIAALYQPLDTDLTEIAAVANVRGDILITDATPTWVRLGKGTANQVLTSDGTDIAWATPAAGSVDVARTWATLQKFKDTTFLVGDDGDITKAVVFSLAGATTAKTLTLVSNHTVNRSLAFPDADGTLTAVIATYDATGVNASLTQDIIPLTVGNQRVIVYAQIQITTAQSGNTTGRVNARFNYTDRTSARAKLMSSLTVDTTGLASNHDELAWSFYLVSGSTFQLNVDFISGGTSQYAISVRVVGVN